MPTSHPHPHQIPEPIYRIDDDELMGYVEQTGASWNCLTLFGYAFDRAGTKEDAVRSVRNRGLEVLTGTWEYLDEKSGEWVRCVLVEVSRNSVRVAHMDGPYPDTTKTHLLTGPLASVLRK